MKRKPVGWPGRSTRYNNRPSHYKTEQSAGDGLSDPGPRGIPEQPYPAAQAGYLGAIRKACPDITLVIRAGAKDIRGNAVNSPGHLTDAAPRGHG
jgi:hypothetical protein